jgi:hypothetical protein
MRTKLITLMALLVASGLLSGCIIEPDGSGYWHHHHHEDHY